MCAMDAPVKSDKHASAKRSSYRSAIFVAVLVAVALQCHRQIITSIAFLGAITETWAYQESPWYLAYLRSQWEKLPEVDAVPLPEIQASEFTQELFWEVTDNLRKPVIIRGAIKNSTACKHWGRDYFVENYPDVHVMAREMLDATEFRVEQVPMRDFWAAFEQGRNVTIFSSSNMFSAQPELAQQAAAPFEDQLRDKNGVGVYLNQFFITPGGRSFLHSELGGNTFRQIAGRKSWMLISPEYNSWLCPHLVGSFVAALSCVQGFEPELREQWFKRIPRMTVVVEAGDIVYNPPWWWHDIVALDADARQTSVAGRMKLRSQSLENSVFQSLLILRKQLKLRAKIKAFAAAQGVDSSQLDQAKVFEQHIVSSWREDCYAAGRNDCEPSLSSSLKD